MERSMEISKLLLSTALALALTACSTATTVRPNNTSNPRTTAKSNQTVVVKQGDTLYAISRRTGVAPQDLAAWNRLTASKTIYPGQVLRLYPEDATASPTPTQPITSRPTPSNPSPTTTSTAPANSGFNWFWPTEGAVVSNFVAGQTTKQGVSINGNNGQTIRAAANGTVVYSGSALIGYGELIIIKHNEQWISAYGHNRKRLVNEGQTVKANQPIAEMGRMLYFEIRYNGKPVDPLVYLPKK
ncbi:peptidoglycan DD-metalloendopeptidase family protein [Xylella fastidiosa]|uniref:peptidoglycan DD-metalloendopeptidase family protein n=1 Tax=Xylella fastidiosa TaxID=2371 RepID=UPI00073388EA|nr:peptidoglycan DD-metalloendopeptidase family protein [Xylella fastidiosa]